MKLFSRRGSAILAAWLLAGCQGSISKQESQGRAPGAEGGRGGGVAGGEGGDGTTEVIALPATCGERPQVARSRLRRLTKEQYANTVKDLLGLDFDSSGFVQDTSTGPFATNANYAPQLADIDNYALAAESLAKRAVANVGTLTKCGGSSEAACAERFVKDIGARAYRRPLAASEVTTLMGVYEQGKAEGFAVGIQSVLEALLQSPSFLYLTEFGEPAEDGLSKLTGHEVATRLSYAFTNSMPSPELFEAAERGDLDTPEGLRGYAEKLLGDKPQFAQTAVRFHEQLLHLANMLDTAPGIMVTKDASLYPEFNNDLRKALYEEPRRFVERHFTEGDGSLETLLTANYSYPQGALLKVYGISAGDLDSEGRYEFPEGTRAGLLTQAGVMATEPFLPTRFGAVYRGNMVRTRILCNHVPDPPAMAAEITLPPNADELSEQELLRTHQENPSCAGCHTLMDNIGFGFQNYDALGRYKTKAADGSPIDAKGNVLQSDVEGEFDGPMELTSKLAQSKDVRACFATQWFRFTLGRDPEIEGAASDDLCSVGAFANKLGEGKGDLREALLTFVSSDAFRYRRGGAQ